jgi:hypothetical protein
MIFHQVSSGATMMRNSVSNNRPAGANLPPLQVAVGTG